jgi:hypothetical protein
MDDDQTLERRLRISSSYCSTPGGRADRLTILRSVGR